MEHPDPFRPHDGHTENEDNDPEDGENNNIVVATDYDQEFAPVNVTEPDATGTPTESMGLVSTETRHLLETIQVRPLKNRHTLRETVYEPHLSGEVKGIMLEASEPESRPGVEMESLTSWGSRLGGYHPGRTVPERSDAWWNVPTPQDVDSTGDIVLSRTATRQMLYERYTALPRKEQLLKDTASLERSGFSMSTHSLYSVYDKENSIKHRWSVENYEAAATVCALLNVDAKGAKLVFRQEVRSGGVTSMCTNEGGKMIWDVLIPSTSHMVPSEACRYSASPG